MSLRARAGRVLLFSLRRPGDRRLDERGRCSVCGASTRFTYNSWILPPDLARDLGGEALVRAFTRRETLWCRRCGSSLRVRRLAAVLLEHYARRAGSLAELVREPGFRALDVAEINSIGTAHPYLQPLPGLSYSEYPQEDVQRLSYGDGSFDLVLTSETLEHVPAVDAALRETRRVLRPGGRLVFTVPLLPTRRSTVDRVAAGLPPQHHGRGSGPFALVSRRDDMLARTDFGLDLVDRLRGAGFEPELHFLHEGKAEPDLGIVVCARAV